MDGGGLQAAVAAHISPGHRADTGTGAAKLFVSTDELGADRVFAPDDVVAVDDHERIIARKGFGDADSVAEAEGLLLADKVDVGHAGNAKALFQHLLLARSGQLFLQLRAAVKVVFNDALVAAQDDQNIGDARTHGFLHQILDGRLVHDGEHPLGHCLGGGEHACAQTRSRDDGFRDFFHDLDSFTILYNA